METITEGQFSGADSPLAEPHFDEEATVLARPVVRLKEVSAGPRVSEVEAKPRVSRAPILSRVWVFGLMLAGALLLGISVTAFYYSRFNSASKPLTVTATTITSGSSGAQSHPTEVKAAPRMRAAQNPDTSGDSGSEVAKTVEPAQTSPQIANKPVARRVAVITFEPRSRGDEESREERRAARREAKDRKREQRNNEDNKPLNELLRIREIFEGPHKP